MSCTVCGRPIRQNRGLVQSLTRLLLALLGSLSAFLRCRCHTPFMSISDRRLESDHGPGSIFSSWACSYGFIAGFPEFAGTTQCFGSPAIAGFIVAAVAAESPAGGGCHCPLHRSIAATSCITPPCWGRHCALGQPARFRPAPRRAGWCSVDGQQGPRRRGPTRRRSTTLFSMVCWCRLRLVAPSNPDGWSRHELRLHPP